MKKIILLLAVIFALPFFASAYSDSPTEGIIYSLNGYAHLGGKTYDSAVNGFGGDMGVTFHLMPENYMTPIIFFSAGCGVENKSLQGDLKLLGGVSWHITEYFYTDLAGGVQGFLYSVNDIMPANDSTIGLGWSLMADASAMLHFAEIIGIRAGCAVSYGTNGLVLSPHLGISSCFDFSWLFL